MVIDYKTFSLWQFILSQLNMPGDARALWVDMHPSFDAIIGAIANGGNIQINVGNDVSVPPGAQIESFSAALSRYAGKDVDVHVEKRSAPKPRASFTAADYFTLRKYVLGDESVVGLVLDMAPIPVELVEFFGGRPNPEREVDKESIIMMLGAIAKKAEDKMISERVSSVCKMVDFGMNAEYVMPTLGLHNISQAAWPEWPEWIDAE